MKPKSGILLLALCISFSFLSNGQDKTKNTPVVLTDSVYLKADIMPEYQGGKNALMNFIASNVQYPQDAKKDRIQGKAFVQFVVNPDGTISNITVIRGVCPSIDEEAIRVIKGMPVWIPGEDKGVKVKVQLVVPINFVLN
jgi:periplasmic protein TonB